MLAEIQASPYLPVRLSGGDKTGNHHFPLVELKTCAGSAAERRTFGKRIENSASFSGSGPHLTLAYSFDTLHQLLHGIGSIENPTRVSTKCIDGQFFISVIQEHYDRALWKSALQ